MTDVKYRCRAGMYPQVGLVLLRLAMAIPFLYAGWWKLTNSGAANGMMTGFGLPHGMGTVIGLVEVLGGLALVFGVFVPLICAVFVILMIAAIYFVTGKMGFALGYQINVVLILGLAALAKLGPGAYSIDGRRGMAGIVADCCGGACGDDGMCMTEEAGCGEGEGCCGGGMCEMPEEMVVVEDGKVIGMVEEEPKA
jgi:putative oxidoreductase